MEWKDKIIDYLIIHGAKMFSAVVIFIVGVFVARSAARLVLKALEKKQMEPPVKMLITRIVRMVVLLLALLIALGTCGVEILPLVMGLSVAGVGVGLAMQGVLSNLVAGLTIIFTKPFRVGEYIGILGVNGKVDQIELFSTTLVQPDLSRLVIPNRKIVGEILHNYGQVRRADLSVGVAYGSDMSRALSLIREVLGANGRVLKEPAPVVGISTLADSSVSISIKPWAALSDFGPMQMELNQAILEKLRANKIEIPFPQREIRILSPAANVQPGDSNQA